MEADWSVALAKDDPMIIVPWSASAEEGGCRFVDLRLDRGPAQGLDHDVIDQIAEARGNPPLRRALLALNCAESPLWTAKCDKWSSKDGPHDAYEMDAEPGETAFGAGSYIDLLARDGEARESFHCQEQWLCQVTTRLHQVQASAARVELVLRRAVVDGRPGFGVSWFVEGCGATLVRAEETWARALSQALATIMGAPAGNGRLSDLT